MSTEKTNEQAIEQYKKDVKSFEDSMSGKKKTFDYAAFKRLVTSELIINKFFTDDGNTCLGFPRCKIETMAEHPEHFGKQILRLSNFMYLRSGYYKRLIDYFVNMAMINYTIDTRILKPDLMTKTKKAIKNDYIKFAVQAEKFNLQNEIQNILKRLYKNDICYAYVIETDTEISYYYLDPMICNISSIVNGNVFEFYINARRLTKNGKITLPQELQDLIDNSTDEFGRVFIPYKNSLCIKYNNDFIFPYPPFFMMIADILLIDDYKELAKAQSINDAYKILTMKIPTKDGEITLDDSLISAFTEIVLNTVQNNIGVVTTPFEMKTEEFSSSNADDRDTVSDAISWAFKNVGVSEALMSGATTASALKLSIINDSGDIYRVYRLIEDWVCLQMKLRNFMYSNYEFVYKIMNTTNFNIDDVKKMELQMAQNGLPNKTRLASANGMSPAVMIGNSIIENDMFGDMFANWRVLQTSYTQSGNSDNEGGRPQSEDGDLSESGENTRNDDEANDPANRDV